MGALALPIESDADDLLEFSQSILAVHESLEILKLKSSPGSLGINQIQKPSFARTIPDARRFQALLGLWQDGGAIQGGHLVSRPELGQEIVDLKPGQVFSGMLLCPCDRHRRRRFLHARVILRLGPKCEGDAHRHVGAESIVGLIVLEALKRHVEVRVILALGQRVGLLVPLHIQFGSFKLRPVAQREAMQIVEGLLDRQLRGLFREAQGR